MNSIAGEVAIALMLDKTRIVDVSVACKRPSVGKALVGLTRSEALDRIGQVYALCPVAQQQAGAAAMALEPRLTSDDAVAEWIKEHSWQCWLMLGDLGLEDRALSATVQLRKGNYQVASELFGMAPEQWLALDPETSLLDWIAVSQAPYARLMAYLTQPGVRTFGTRVTPNASLRRCNQHRFVRYFKADCGELLLRTLARLVESAQLLSGQYLPPQADISAEGMAQVEASRGRLLHRVDFEQREGKEVIGDYQIVAPTDRHCAFDGVLASSLRQSELPGEDLSCAHLLIKAIDPCVPYTLKVEKFHA